MIAGQQSAIENTQSQPRTAAADPWQLLEQEGATERALNDLLGYLEEDLKLDPGPLPAHCLFES